MAQKVFSGISPSDFAACKKFLSENPTDTVVGVVNGKAVKVFVGTDGRIKRTAGTVGASAVAEQQHEVKSAKKTAEGAERVNKDGTKTEFQENSLNGMGYEGQLAFIHGQKEAYNLQNRGLDGKLVQRYMVYALGGVFYGDRLAPMVTLGAQKDFFKYFALGAEAEYSRLRYTEAAEASGYYDSFALYVAAKWYPFQNTLLGGSSRLGIGTAWGYMLQRTDSDEATDHSKNYGVSAKFFIDAQLSLGKNFYGLFQGGIKWYPKVSHHEEGQSGAQEFLDNIGPYGQLGLGYRF
jgi:hypothetical protein